MDKKCVIIDDEPLAHEVLEEYIDKLDGFRVVASCSDALEAFSTIKREKPDLLFLDIEMPEMNGLQFLQSLQKPPKVILTTAYREYAVEAFDLDVVDYLLKPIRFERFMRAVDRFYETASVVSPKESTKLIEDGYLAVHADGKIFKIALNEILFVESFGNYVEINLADKKLVTREGISHLEQKLPQELFLRAHRSFLLAINSIVSFNRTSIQLEKRTFPISRKYQDHVLKRLGELG
ncbi:LytTR family DNA-binding domain-containing protein [Flammeovirgaceae bacterium SG7u.111]|nr:LytTR family DNA-binding domain-containing protein [Flammeovirgaceae bacterium SG7u.132]WPO33816.1 LytTR family DNA-binding domain-containing protein [Flammeovirgaceae bacterium SG7u.111]